MATDTTTEASTTTSKPAKNWWAGDVEVKLDRPYVTNGVTFGYETKKIEGKNRQVFTGIAHVNQEVADDLNERQETFRTYEKELYANKGRSDVEVQL